MKSFILSTLLITLRFGELIAAERERAVDSKLNCEGCNYYPQENITKLIKCNQDGSQLSVMFNGDNGCSNWNEYINSSSINNTCCPKDAMKPALEDGEQEALIVGGTSVKADNYPFIAYFSQNNPIGTSVHFCGGSIIRKQDPAIILTAAHCMYDHDGRHIKIDIDSDDTFVRLNANEWDDHSSIKSWIYKTVVHPEYDGHPSHGHDVALLFLETDISTSDELSTVTINRVSPGYECCNNGEDLQVIGYGDDFAPGSFNNGDPTPTLEFADINYIPRTACNTNYKYSNGQITENMLCAQSWNTNSCKGDSGGPLIRKGTSKQVGIVSWSSGRCADPDYPSTYVDVGVFYDWIQWYIVYDWN